MKTLLVAPSWIGDAVAAQPLLRRLREADPQMRLDVLAPAWVAAVLMRMPEVHCVVENPFAHGELRLRERWRLGRRLAREGYDQAVVLPNSWKSALVPFFAGIPKRIGYTGEARLGLLNLRHRMDARATPQIAERYAQLAQPPGTPLERPLPVPRLAVDAAARQRTLAEFGLSMQGAPVAICPGAEYGPAKRWPVEHFAEFARELAGHGHAVWLIGSPKDAPVGQAIAELAGGGCRNLCGGTNLGQAIELLASASFVVSNDSGLMHVAAALDRPMLALFGSSSPRFTPPLSEHAEVIWKELDCSPCFKRECPLGHFRCMREITPAEVSRRVLARLQASDTRE